MQTMSPGGLGPTLPPALGRVSFLLAALAGLLLPSMGTSVMAGGGDSTVLQIRIDAAAHMLKHESRLAPLSDARRRDAVRFVIGNMLFVLLHEVGHVVMTELGLPVLGREEDAADSYASIMMLTMKDEFSERVLSHAAKGWFYSDRRDQLAQEPAVFYDSHSLSRQRAYQIICFMVGSDPEKFAALADEVGLPEYRQRTCAGDFNNAEWSWQMALKDHWRTTQPRTEIRVSYGEPDERLELFARVIKNIELLDLVAERLSERYAWRAPFAIEAKACGIARAEWNLATRTLTICYELAEEFATLFCSYEPEFQLMSAAVAARENK